MKLKDLTIIEAKEANKTHKVVSPNGQILNVGAFHLIDDKNTWPGHQVFGKWSILIEPEELWVCDYEDGARTTFASLKAADMFVYPAKRIRCRKFLEVK